MKEARRKPPAILFAEDADPKGETMPSKTPAEQILEVLSPGAEARFNTLLERRVAEEVEAALGPDSPDVLMEVDVDNDGASWVQVRKAQQGRAARRVPLEDALGWLGGGPKARKAAQRLRALADALEARKDEG